MISHPDHEPETTTSSASQLDICVLGPERVPSNTLAQSYPSNSLSQTKRINEMNFLLEEKTTNGVNDFGNVRPFAVNSRRVVASQLKKWDALLGLFK
jgi:hypothetical protein